MDAQQLEGKRSSVFYSGLVTGKKVLGNIIFVLLILVMAILVFFLIQSRISGGTPTVAGHQMYIVLSGSMSPAFETGSMVVVKTIDPTQVVVGDIITFKDSDGNAEKITHRVTAVEATGSSLNFTTRGDANNADDLIPVPAENIIGKVVVAIPYVGYLVSFSQTKQGIITLVAIPGLLIIALEISNLFKYTRQIDQEKEAQQKPKGQSSDGEDTNV